MTDQMNDLTLDYLGKRMSHYSYLQKNGGGGVTANLLKKLKSTPLKEAVSPAFSTSLIVSLFGKESLLPEIGTACKMFGRCPINFVSFRSSWNLDLTYILSLSNLAHSWLLTSITAGGSLISEKIATLLLFESIASKYHLSYHAQ